jgi:hypothetical protein
MRMEAKILSPGVQNGCMPDFCSQILLVSGQFLLGFRHAAKQQIVATLLVTVNQRIQFLRNGKHDMEISNIQQIRLPRINPAFFCESLALWAVAIAAGIVGRPLISAVWALVQMPAEPGRPAVADCIPRFTLNNG